MDETIHESGEILHDEDDYEVARRQIKFAADQRVLLVEDCADTRAMIAHMLRKHGVQVVTAEDGESFVGKVMTSENDETPFDLVLLDINLPKLDGVEATRILRKSGYEKPIIAITAGPSLQEKNASIHAGCNGFLAKSELRYTLGQMMQQYLRPL